jgi:hypothetical protein
MWRGPTLPVSAYWGGKMGNVDIEQFAKGLEHTDGTPYAMTDAQRRVFRAFADGGEALAKSFRLVPPTMTRAGHIYGEALGRAARLSSLYRS